MFEMFGRVDKLAVGYLKNLGFILARNDQLLAKFLAISEFLSELVAKSVARKAKSWQGFFKLFATKNRLSAPLKAHLARRQGFSSETCHVRVELISHLMRTL